MADGPLPVEGVDYAWSRPDIAALAAAGKRFACRYGGPGSAGKQLDPTEAHALSAAGVAIVANAEGAANGLINGFAAGASWARDAEAHFRECGMPPGRPIYFSVDFDTTSGDWAALDAAMDGAASVIGRGRVGVYGEYSIIEHFAANRKAVWYWQTYGWSGGRWSPHNHIEQYRNGVSLAGAVLDLDRALTSDFGQWTIGDEDVASREEINADQYLYEIVREQDEIKYITGPDGRQMRLPNLPLQRLKRLEEKLDKLTIPAPAPVDPAALKAALLDPEVLAAIATAVNDDDHRRSKE